MHNLISDWFHQFVALPMWLRIVLLLITAGVGIRLSMYAAKIFIATLAISLAIGVAVEMLHPVAPQPAADVAEHTARPVDNTQTALPQVRLRH